MKLRWRANESLPLRIMWQSLFCADVALDDWDFRGK